MSAPPDAPASAFPTLAQLQQRFAQALLCDVSPWAPPQGVSGLAGIALELGVEPEALVIYQNTVLSALHTALTLNFPAVRALVGADFFEASAREFMQGQPPRQACLNDYGATFAEFLAGFAPVASLGYLPDVARLEWAVCRALHAPDVPVAPLQGLARLDPTQMARVRFDAHPALTVLHLDYPVEPIWRAVLGEDPDALTSLDGAARQNWLLVERAAGGVQVQAIESRAGEFLQSLCRGEALASAIKAFGPEPDPVELQVALAAHLAAGRLTAWHVGPA